MKRIDAVARIVKQDESPAAGLKVRLQLFGLAENAWRDIAQGAADAAGNVRLAGDHAQADDLPAPNLRLARASDGASLADGGLLRYAKTTQVLAVDFGQIVDLPEAVVATPTDPRRFRGAAHAVGGVPLTVGTAFATAAQPQFTAMSARATQLEGEVGNLTRDNQQLRIQATRVEELERANTQLGEQAKRVPDLERRVADTTQLNERLTRDVARVGDLEARLGQSTQENARLKVEAARAAQLEKDLGDAKGQIEKLRAPTAKTATMNMVALDIGSQIGRAQEQIRAEPGSLGLSSVRVRLKGIVEPGAKVTLPDASELAKPEVAAALSEVDMNFEATPPPPPPPDQVQVPDVRRLTESAVRQVLHSIGLRLSSVTGPPGSGGVAPGQASLQAPAAGEQAKRGATVTVVFAG
ncbi:MAG TPA: PASTA domain-containing protein [Allosphingosinicella sp.]